MRAERSDAERGYAAYTRVSLAFYDWWVLGVSNRRIWDCPTETLLEFYREHLSDNHLEVGVGTGYFLENVGPDRLGRVVLLDANRACLERASFRLAEWGNAPETLEEDALEPFHRTGERFDSVALNYVLHCMPGRLEEKAGAVLENLAPHVHEDGIVFGSTILGTHLPLSVPEKLLMAIYNFRGIFSNREDSLRGLIDALSAHSRLFNVEVTGDVARFWAKGVK